MNAAPIRARGARLAAPGGHRDRWKVALFAAAAASLVAGIGWALLGSSFLVVRSVQVIGSARIPRQTVLDAAGVRLGTPLIRVDLGAVARKVEQITQVQSARVTRSWPDAIVIWIKPRTAVLAVATRGGFDRIDRYGVVLGWSSAPPGLVRLTLPGEPAGGSGGSPPSTSTAGGSGASPPSTSTAGGSGGSPPSTSTARLRGNAAVFAAGTVISQLPAWLRMRVSSVTATGPAAVTLVLRGGQAVAWGGPGRGAAKAAELAILLRTGARYYDVSDPATAVTGASVPALRVTNRLRTATQPAGRGRVS